MVLETPIDAETTSVVVTTEYGCNNAVIRVRAPGAAAGVIPSQDAL